MIQILQGDWIERLRELPDQCVQCCVTSPPYWGLRDYGVEGQLGLEKTPDQYVEKLVLGFGEVRRVLRDDGTLWLNLGDSYSQGNKGNSGELKEGYKQSTNHGSHDTRRGALISPNRRGGAIGLCKQKDMIGIPWMVAFALRADGWYLRSDIIWSKPNPMPESVTDRPTKSHEYIFLLSKSGKYFYDAVGIAEPCQSGPSDLRKMAEGLDPIDAKYFHEDPGSLPKANPRTNIGKKRGVGGLWAIGSPGPNSRMFKDRDPAHLSRSGNKERDFEGRLNHKAANIPWEGFKRNKRTVWSIATVPYKGAHFATFPPELITPCILAGTKHGDTVLDPFAGSGTTGQVALELGRKVVLIELNPKYIEMIKQRTKVTPALNL